MVVAQKQSARSVANCSTHGLSNSHSHDRELIIADDDSVSSTAEGIENGRNVDRLGHKVDRSISHTDLNTARVQAGYTLSLILRRANCVEVAINPEGTPGQTASRRIVGVIILTAVA